MSSSRRGPTPRRRPPPQPTPAPATGFRAAVERRSAVLLVWLTHQPKLLVPGLVFLLLVGGALLPPAAGVPCLVLVLLLVLWLSLLSWPVLRPAQRVLRLLVAVLLVVLLATRF